ncbi:hypothetical protein AGMMS50284_7600 [Clostridia bacterium]|nr:hypothetical protein AGMMS50284_7600 [Clostridia bacterium]
MADNFVNVNATSTKAQAEAKRVRTIVIAAIAAVVVIIVLFSSVLIIPAGHRGVLMNMGAVSGTVMSEGVNFKTPFFQSVQVIDTRMKKLESTGNASASKDLQSITSAIAVNYRVDSNTVNDLYKNIGMDYESTIIVPAISECMKAVTSRYTAEELITKRTEVSAAMKEFLQTKLTDKYIIVDSFNVMDFEFSDAFNKAIEEKQIAEQRALKAQYDLKRIKTEAEQTVQKAEGEAEAMRIKNERISANIIQLEFIDKWDGKMPTYYGGDGNLFLGMDTDTGVTASKDKNAQ